MTFRFLVPVLGALALAGCGGSNAAPVKSASTTAQPPSQAASQPRPRRQRAAAPLPPPPVQRQVLPGVDGVIGASEAELVRQFGAARLEVWEGDARKLQFSGTACVLDVYLYPPAAGREPQASFVDARLADGRDVDRAGCIAALRKR